MNKTLLTIGAGPGIGLATARRFAAEGFEVILAARDAARLAKSVTEAGPAGERVTITNVDAADGEAVSALVERYGPDVLHYNAGVLRYGPSGQLKTQPLTALSLSTIDSDLRTNIGGALATVRACMPIMLERGAGTILLTGGGLATAPHPDLLTLSVGKAGIRAIAQGMFDSLRERGVHIAHLAVGKIVDPSSGDPEAIADAFWRTHSQPPADWTWESQYPQQS